MKNRILFGALQSSQDPEQLAVKVKGIILALSSIIILVASQVFHIGLNGNDVMTIGTELGAVAGAIMAIYGAIQHLVTWFGSKPVAPTV